MNPWRRFVRFLDRVSDEGHASERLAMRWHRAHALARCVVLVLDIGELLFHSRARLRHQRAASKLPARAEKEKGA